MNLLLKKLSILVLVLLSSFFISNAAQYCCYENGRISVNSCNDGINLGEVRSSAGNSELCPNDYTKRRTCETPSNTYRNTLGGYEIYENSEVYNEIADETGYDPKNESICQNLITYDDTYSDSGNDPDIGSGNPGDSGSGGDDDDSSSDDEELTPSHPEYEIGADETYEDLIGTCSNLGGGLKGLFNNKNTCENLKFNSDSNENPCIYNPYRGGLFSTRLNYDYPNSLKEFEEPACILKKKIRYCSDYKTKNNCETNPAVEGDNFGSKSTALDEGCKWVESEQYASSLKDQDSGMCISKSVDEDSNFISGEFKNRQNIIKNPSFRDGTSNWTTDGGRTFETSFDDDEGRGGAINLSSGETLTQTINRLGSTDIYITKFQMKTKGDYPDVEIVEYYEDGSEQVKSPQVDEWSSQETNIFSPISYRPLSISGDAKTINFSIIANSNTIIDMVALESSSSNSMGISHSSSFIPVEIIPREASSCSLCYDPLGLNTCTQEKSNRLGACSYMVSGPEEKYSSSLSDYSGKVNNEFHGLWGSQSLSNSDVFCEMYVNKSQCSDSDNIVNKKYSSLHLNSEADNLCKWNNEIGCFKDSNDDDIPDVYNGMIQHNNLTSGQEATRNIAISTNNRYNHDVSNGVSDFELACDPVPPMVYNYIEAKNSSGDYISIENENFPDLIGNASLVLDIKDYFPFEGPCREYSNRGSNSNDNVNPQTYIVLELKDKSIKKEFNQYSIDDSIHKFNLKEVFSPESLSTNPEIEIEVFDQSGNLGLKKSIEVGGMDLVSPELWLKNLGVKDGEGNPVDNPSSNGGFRAITDYLTLESQFNFTIEDQDGGINSCTYFFDEDKSEKKTIDYDSSKSDELSINVSNHFSQDDIPVTGMTSYLNVSCKDIFGQETSREYFFEIVGDFLMIEPAPFKLDPQNYTGEGIEKYGTDGIYNKKTKQVLAYSSRNDIQSCEIGGNGLDIDEGGPFEVEEVDGGSFPIKITGNLNFNDDGQSEETISIICEAGSSQLSYPYTYFYEEEEPIMENYSLYGDKNFNQTYYDEDKDRWYSILNPKELNYNLTLDGTKSWISKYYNVYLNRLNKEDVKINEDRAKIYSRIDYKNYSGVHNFKSNAIINNIGYNSQRGSSQDSIEYNFLRYDFNLELIDKANNTNNQSLEYYYDNTTPEIKFSGDIISQDDEEGYLFTSKKDPEINVSFNTPSYRKYSCGLSIDIGENPVSYIIDFDGAQQNSFSFKLSEELRDTIDVSNQEIKFSLNCEDETYDIEDNINNNGRTYEFEFDNTPPVLENLSFGESSQRYFKLGDGSIMNSISDDLVFEFNDTGEKGYKCEYRVEPPSTQNYYSCNSSQDSRNFDESIIQEVSPYDLLVGNVEGNGENRRIDRYLNDDNYKCYQRTNNFWNEYDSKVLQDDDYVDPIKTEIKIVAKCEDKVGLETQEKSTTLDVVYSKSDIVGVEFDYDDGQAKPEITLVSPGLPRNLEFVFKKNDGEVVFRSEASELEDIARNSAYEVSFENGIDLKQFFWGEYRLTLEVYSGDNLIDSKNNIPLLVDSTVPNSNITILDNIDGEIDSKHFEINLKGSDKEPSSGIGDVRLYAKQNDNERELIYSKEENSEVTYEYEDGSPIIVRDKNNDFEVNYFFKGEQDSQYEFTLEVEDSAGNIDTSNITTQIVNDAKLTLLDTNSARIFSNPYELLTRSNEDEELEIRMDMDPLSTCLVNPYLENKMEGITDKSKNSSVVTGGELSVDMRSQFDSFSMEKAQDNTILLYIECERDGEISNFIRKLTKISGVPDYTLESSEGFYYNSYDSNHYSTRLDIESVGPYKQILCNMDFENQDFELGPGTGFSLDYNFSSEISQTNRELTLQCEDPFGVKGAEKTYDFVVSKKSIEIGDIYLLGDNSRQKATQEGDTLYVAENQNYNFQFEVNKRGGSCDYKIDGNENWFDITTGYIKNLLNIGYNSIDESQTPYIYLANEMSFSQDSKIDIECGGGNRDSKSVNVEVVDEESSYEVDIS